MRECINRSDVNEWLHFCVGTFPTYSECNLSTQNKTTKIHTYAVLYIRIRNYWDVYMCVAYAGHTMNTVMRYILFYTVRVFYIYERSVLLVYLVGNTRTTLKKQINNRHLSCKNNYDKSGTNIPQ